jgi:tetratricopeptide (TPR) repeat protein
MNPKISLIFLILCLMLGSCQTPKYSKVTNFTNFKNFIPEVQFTISENFNPENINCIAVGKIEDKSDINQYKSLDKVSLIRQAIYAHLSPKNFQDVELHKIAPILKSLKNSQTILQNLGCDALLEGEITSFKNDFFIAYSSTNVGLNLFLKDQNNKILWKSSHTATSRAGSIPFSPIGLATGLFSASTNAEDEIAFQMIDTVVRRLLKTLPDKSNVRNEEQLKFAKIPNDSKTKNLINYSQKKQNTPQYYFGIGEYGNAIALINKNLKSNPDDHKLIFLKGRSQLMLNEFESASSTFLDALALKLESDYLNGLGHAYSKLNQTNKALAAYNKAISIDNKNSYAYFNAGLLLENAKNKKKAAKYFYSAGTSSLLNKNFVRAGNALVALKRLSKSESSIKENSIKLESLIKKLSDDRDYNFKIIKVNSKG